MNALELISVLRDLDVEITVNADRLRVNAPKGVLTPELQAELKERKSEIIALLAENGLAPQAGYPPLVKVSRDAALPLSSAQQRLWFLSQMTPDSPVYNVPMAFRLSGPLNQVALERSLTEIVRRHEILRTSFRVRQRQPLQIISQPTQVTLPLVNLSALPEHEQEIKIQQVKRDEATQPFDLSQDLLLRGKLVRLAETEHILLITTHHIVFDGWSFDIFCRELSTLYDAFDADRPSPLGDLPIQYVDFAAWQRAWLRDEKLEFLLTYWRDQLNHPPPALQLPSDRPRPAVQTLRGAWHSFVLSQDLAASLKGLSVQAGSTLFMTLLAAFNVLLYRYTGQDDLVVGTPIANRHQTQFEGLIGPFINTLALRSQLAPDMSFRELLTQVKAVSLQAFLHQDLPFERLVEELNLERSLSHSPLFQVMFSLQNKPPPSLELSGLAVSDLAVNTGTAKFDLSLGITDVPHGLQGIAEYSLDIFQSATIERLVGHLQVLLEDIVVNPDTPIGQLSLLTEAERQQLLVRWNATHSDFPKDACAHQLFEAQAVHRADAVAAVSEDRQLTYRELNSRANQVAHHLLSLGVGPEKLVGICMERSLEMIVSILGTLKAGGAFLPLDPMYPPERLAFMLEDAQASVLLTQQRLVGRLPQRVSQIICLDADWRSMADHSQENPASGVEPDNLAYVIYTSGSSGLPKGVEIEHTSLVNLITWHQTVFHVTSTDRATQLAGPAFDASVWEIWPYLTAGATIYLPDEDTLLSPTRLIQWLAANEITISFLPTPLAESVLAEEWPADMALRILLTGGDRLHHAPRRKLPFLLVNNYGPTENTVVSTWTPVTESDQGLPPPIGRPIFNTQLYVLDPHRQPVPVGVPGELYVGGVGLARGYLNRAELTAARFIPHPLSDDPAARLYRTGDLVRYLPDGNLDFLGRIDNQVKVRGFRIELGEIEAVLGQHPGVREAVVVDQEETPTQKRLAAYYVVKDQENSPTIDDLRSFLRQKLPDYMLPSLFVELDLLPLTPNGKVDRRALPTPEKIHLGQAENLAPRDLLELQLTRAWGEVLGIENVGVRDNFFEIGGQSLSAVRLVSQIEKLTGNKLPVSGLFQAPTVEQLARLLRRDGWSAPTSSLVAIQASGSKPPLFFVPGNLGNVFTDLGELARHLGPDQPFYGLQDSIENPIQVEALARHYVEAICAVQPQGPYLLGGVCSGGLIAFEMARQLHSDGREVALVALVESYPHSPGLGTYIGSAAAFVRRVLRGTRQHARQISQASAAEQGTYLRLKAKVLGNLWGAVRYSLQPYPGRLELFFTREGLDSIYAPQAGWCRLAKGGVAIHEIPGSHDSITGDNDAEIEAASMQALAEQLQTCIERALRPES